ncbi:MAG: YfbK domain-containing protein [Acidimicrobiales bacterium]
MATALVTILALIAGACAGDDDDSSVSEVSEVSGEEGLFSAVEPGGSGDGGSRSSDAEANLAPRPGTGDVSAGDGASDPVAESALGEADLGGRAAAAPEAETAMATSGGLFAQDSTSPEPVPPPLDDHFRNYGVRDFVDTDDDPISTFALDVDTGAYTVARQYLDSGQLPPVDSVRVEEYVNVFDYDYDEPRRNALGVSLDGGPSPFDDDNYLVRIGVQSDRLDDDDRPVAALTFVIDTSGSMEQGGRLELVKEALEELVSELEDNDTIAIVEFDDYPSVVLEPTRVRDDGVIYDSLDALRPGGSTNVEGGLALGYDLARETLDDDQVNRVILLSDGVANVGLVDPDGLARMIRDDADRGIQLLTIGVGMGNFNDELMEQLADQGDGFYAYVDTDDEAERLFEDNLTATLVTLAIDAKIQVEFDEDVVEEYRLIGFENRGVLDSDFRNDDVDAGEIGAGHQVTAIYEVELRRGFEPGDREDIGEVHLRWEEPGTGEIIEIDEEIELDDVEESWRETSDSFKLAVVAATFAEVLRASPFASDIDLDDLEEEVENLADRTRNRAVDGLLEMVETAERLV